MSAFSDAYRTGSDVSDASRLIGFSLQPKILPAPNPEYAALLGRYLTDTDFETVVRAVATGLDLTILDASTAAGLIVGSTEDSVFEWKVSDYAKRAGAGRTAADRVLHGIIHVAIAASAFPRPADLSTDGSLQRVSAQRVDRFLRATIDKLLATAEDTDPALQAVGEVFKKRPQAAATSDARRFSGSTISMVARALEFLSEQGMVARVGDEEGGTYRTTLRYQVQVRELAAGPLYGALLALHDEQV